MEKKKKKTVRTMVLMAFMSAGATAAAMTGSAHAETALSRSLSDDGKASFQMANVVSASGFTQKSGTVYFLKRSEISRTPDMNTPAGTADKFASAELTGVSDRSVWRISSNGGEYYVRAENVTDDRNVLNRKIKEEKKAEAAKQKAEAEKNREVLNRAVSEEKAQAYSDYQKKAEEKQKQKEKEEAEAKAKAEAEKKKAAEEAAKRNRLAARAGSLAEAKEAASSQSTSERFRNAPSNAEKIWVYLTEHGVSDTVAAAALGNIQAESSFNPRATDGGTGLIQWTSARAARLRAYAGSSGMWTIEGQMSYLLHEFATSESGAYARIKAAGSPSAAAYAWDRYYERSAGLSTSTRMRNAVKWYNTFHTGK